MRRHVGVSGLDLMPRGHTPRAPRVLVLVRRNLCRSVNNINDIKSHVVYLFIDGYIHVNLDICMFAHGYIFVSV